MNGLTGLILLGTLSTTGSLFTGRYLQSPGTITGIVRDLQGTTISGVRVAALQTPEIGAVNLGILSSITTTDREGRYTLENVVPGRYYIAAGRVDAPAYFPGTHILSDAIAITVEPGYVISAIDFRINHLSVAVSSLAAVNGWARLAPYSDIIWTETSDRPFVLVDGSWAELYSINGYFVP